MRSPIRSPLGTVNCDTGRKPTTTSDHTSRLPTSLHWNLSPVGNTTSERRSVTNLLDEYRRLRGGRAAAKIRCLLGRSRLRRKRGRLFLRLGWRSQDERPATRVIGLTPLELFSSVTAVRKYSTRR